MLNINADALSRAEHLPEPTLSENEEYAEYQEQEEPHIMYEERVYEVEFHQTSQEDVRRKQETDPVWKKVLEWAEKRKGPSLRELRGKEQEVLVACSLYSPELFQIRNNMLVFQMNTDKNRTETAGQIFCSHRDVPRDLEYLS